MSKQSRPTPDTKTLSSQQLRGDWYALIVATVLGAAIWLLLPALANRFAPQVRADVLSIEAAMDGFSSSRIEAKVGEPLTVQLRSLNTPYHTDGGGKHQFAIDELGVNIVAPPKGVSEAMFTPDKPGTYTFYCDICCGGRANPSVQGTLVVTA